MEKTLKLLGVSIHPKTKDKDYNLQGNRYETDCGTYTSFDDKGCNSKLVANIGKYVVVEVKESDKFKNIIGFIRAEEGTEPPKVVHPNVQEKEKVAQHNVQPTPPEFPFKASVKQSAAGKLYIGEVSAKGEHEKEVLEQLASMTSTLLASFEQYNKAREENNGKEKNGNTA